MRPKAPDLGSIMCWQPMSGVWTQSTNLVAYCRQIIPMLTQMLSNSRDTTSRQRHEAKKSHVAMSAKYRRAVFPGYFLLAGLFLPAAPAIAQQGLAVGMAGRKLASMGAGDGPYGEISYSVDVLGPLSLGIGTGYSRFRNDSLPLKGSVEIIPILVRLRASFGKAVVFYMEQGVGYYLMDHEADASASILLSDFDDAIGLFMGIGVQAAVYGDIGIVLGLGHHFVDTKFTATVVDAQGNIITSRTNADMGFAVAGGGLWVRF